MTTTTCDHQGMDLDTLFGHSCPDDIRPMMRATRPVGINGLTEEQHYGTGSGNGSARTSSMATEPQVKFLVSLGMDEKAARRLNKTAASAEIDARKAERDAQPKTESKVYGGTDKQAAFIRKLIAEKCADVITDVDAFLLTLPDTRTASKMIDELLKMERKTEQPKSEAKTFAELEDGMYKRGELVVKVYHAVHGSGQQVSKTWDADVQGFEYTGKRGLRGLTAEHKMTLEDAKAFGQVYGICCVCARTLTDEESIANGIGPICAKGF